MTYDQWKTHDPAGDCEVCGKCGTPLERERIRGRTYWYCERCDAPPDPDHWRDAA